MSGARLLVAVWCSTCAGPAAAQQPASPPPALTISQAVDEAVDHNLSLPAARVNAARVATGSIAPFESIRSQVAMLQFRSTVVKAELELAAATARLRTLVGRPPAAPIDVAGNLAAARSPQPPDAAALEQVAL